MAPELYPTTLAKVTGTSAKPDFNYDAKAVDIYAMGVCLFEMCTLAKPYAEVMNTSTMNKIEAQEIQYQNREVDAACKELICAMLKLSPAKRPTIDDVVKHRWIRYGTVINAVVSFADTIFH